MTNMRCVPALLSLLLLCLPCGAFAQQFINFRNEAQLSYHDDMHFLRLPYVDEFQGIPGLYHDATIEYSPLTNTWRAYGFKPSLPLAKTEVGAVNLRVVGETPVQVFLEITGSAFPCASVGHAGIRQDGNVFVVYLFYDRATFTSICVRGAPYRSFRKVVPLDVYGLPAGNYAYDVQGGTFGGSFTLTAENVLK